MEWILNIPALLKIFLTLGLIVTLLKFKIPLSISIICGSVFIGAFFRMTPGSFINTAYHGIISDETISLLLVITGILILSNMLSISGRLERIVNSFKGIVGNSRITLVTFPAVIGLLPMPGGAVFSAPMVEAVSENSGLSPVQKTSINYWFRHIWEYWYPLYPGAILSLSLSKMPAWKFMSMNFPMTLFALGAGYLIILKNISLSEKKHRDYSKEKILGFLYELIPIFIVIGALLFLGIVFSMIKKSAKIDSDYFERLPIFIGIITSILWIIISDKIKWVKIKPILTKKAIWEMAFMILGLMIFKRALADSNDVDIIKQELLDYNIPVLALIIALPFIAGLVTGIAMGFVGVSYPIVISIIATLNISSETSGSYFFAAYVSGFIGMMLSPVHLCLLLTKDYFKANLLNVYLRYLIPVIAINLIPGVFLYLIYRYFQI